ncbi:MAG: xanthine dehydrogenase family protein molybdopterin-binding subunit [Treponema sp.]|nr:xanthine dehydrogenase family protein molybdopterin-binding subunit [Treponema sp.]
MSENKIRRKGKKRVSRNSYLSNDYFIDCSKADMLYAALVRSPLPSGKITNINFSELPEGYYFFSARDIPGKNEISTLDSCTRVFCNEKVHFEGQAVGIICGPDLEKTRKLTKDIQITFDITTIESALKEASKNYSRPVIKLPGQEKSKDGEIADLVDMMNILPALDELPREGKKSTYTEPEQIEKAVESINPLEHKERILAKRIVKTGFFKLTDDEEIIKDEYNEAKYHIQGSWNFDESSPDWIEPSGAFCYKEGNKLNILTTTLWSSYLSKNIANVLNMDEDKIVIQKTRSQTENTNGIWRTTTLAAQTALASFLTEKPVKLILSKEEQKKYMKPGLNTQISYDSAIMEDGTIKAMRINVECDAGYANPFAQEIADRITVAAAGLYSVENLSISVNIHSSSKAPTSIYAEIIDSQAFFALENHIQQISKKTSILPDELRIKNICQNSKTSLSPYKFKVSKPVETIEAIIRQSDFNRKYSSFLLNSEQNRENYGHTFFSLPRRGIGLSTAYDGSCFYGTLFPLKEEKIELTLDENENLIINAISPSATNSAIWKKIAGDILELDTAKITINSEYAVTEETFMPENFYHDISIMTVLLKRAAEEINRKRNSQPLPISSKKAITPAMRNQWKKEKFTGFPFQSTSFGAAIVEVELNSDTYREKINGIWIAIDCGQILSLKAAENAVRLAVQREMEKLIKDTNLSYDQLKISFLESNNPPCQIGKLIHNLIPAAFSSALSLALSKDVISLPCTEQELYELTLFSPSEVNDDENLVEITSELEELPFEKSEESSEDKKNAEKTEESIESSEEELAKEEEE